MEFVVLSGMSGAGKSTALKMMEDIGYYCVDNLPIPLLSSFISLAKSNEVLSKVAVGIDIRGGQNPNDLVEVIKDYKDKEINIKVLFLDCQDEILIKRYKETRRSHPLAEGDRVEKGIMAERGKIDRLREISDYIIDTTKLLTKELLAEIKEIFVNEISYKNLYISVLSFGFKYGIPSDADLVFDVRFLRNPYYVDGMREKTGLDQEVRDFVMDCDEAKVFLDKLMDMVSFLLPNYISEGKTQLVIAIGCTGGKHRSVTLAQGLYERLVNQADKNYGLRIEHRDILR